MALKAKWRTIRCCAFGMYMADINGRVEECEVCGGSMQMFILPNGAIADYPGGPFRGNWGPETYAKGEDYIEPLFWWDALGEVADAT